MKIVLAPFGSRGDIQPMLVLGRALRTAGHEVLVAASDSYAAWASRLELKFATVSDDVETWLRRRGGSTAMQNPIQGWKTIRAYVHEVVPQTFVNTRAAAEGADLLVGASLQLAAPSVAEALGL